jgi:hypothetical protein
MYSIQGQLIYIMKVGNLDIQLIGWWGAVNCIDLNKMVFISQTHLFIIVLNVLFGQHVSTLY